MAKNEAMHVQVENSLYLRKLVLQTAIDSAALIKDYEEFSFVSKLKKKKISSLKNILNNIKGQDAILNKSNLPKVEHEKPVVVKAKKKVSKVIVKENPEIDLLQKELSEIEAKLKRL